MSRSLAIVLICCLLSPGLLPACAKRRFKKTPKQDTHIEAIKLEEEKNKDKKLSDFEKKRAELKANEKKALEFIFSSIKEEKHPEREEEFFSQTERDQLLELWRATLARNRTIQFIIKTLAVNPNDIEQNNAILQGLTRALFVPFYAVAAITESSLIAGGSAVGARVIGDVVDDGQMKSDRLREITKTELIVMFMLVDEVAERLRKSYFSYKEAKSERAILEYDIQGARLDAAEALTHEHGPSLFLTRTIVRDYERKLRENKVRYLASRKELISMAGLNAVDSVDNLLDLEIKELINNV